MSGGDLSERGIVLDSDASAIRVIHALVDGVDLDDVGRTIAPDRRILRANRIFAQWSVGREYGSARPDANSALAILATPAMARFPVPKSTSW